ncbi:hypothetical protein [Burkholderia sp. MSMB1588]|uniref:hypothetical protein n=1 Tax=Burkholderia sp. MSMB1588 TaxID=1636423 RepID=UPI001F5BB868|nr:hypothetical protein [Burkholderia sp. MSMB1588]
MADTLRHRGAHKAAHRARDESDDEWAGRRDCDGGGAARRHDRGGRGGNGHADGDPRNQPRERADECVLMDDLVSDASRRLAGLRDHGKPQLAQHPRDRTISADRLGQRAAEHRPAERRDHASGEALERAGRPCVRAGRGNLRRVDREPRVGHGLDRVRIAASLRERGELLPAVRRRATLHFAHEIQFLAK